MTVRVTALKGADAGDYYVKQLPNYYLKPGEPRGIWFGDGATTLALIGDVDDDAFVALMAGMDPTRPDRNLCRSYDDKSVRGFDVTASAPKSVSVRTRRRRNPAGSFRARRSGRGVGGVDRT